MQQSANCGQFKQIVDLKSSSWNGRNDPRWEINFLPASGESNVNSCEEAEADIASTPNSSPESVITSSNLCGVVGASTLSVNVSHSSANAHDLDKPSSSPKVGAPSLHSGSSMLCVSSFQTQSDSQKSSNSQSAQSTFPTFVGDFSSVAGRSDEPQGSLNKLMNQNHLGAKRALSEPYSSQKPLASSSRYSAIDNSVDMQTNVHKMDSTSRYKNNSDVSSSHNGPGNFMNGNGSYRNNESGRVHNQNSSYGAQFNSPAEKAKSQGYGCENNGNSDSPYSGWQGLNAAVSSSSSNNGWNIPDGSPATGRSIHGNHENLANNADENMIVDNDATSFSGLLGATGGTDNYSDEKSNSSNNFLGNSHSMHMPRLGLLGGGENSLTSQSSGWNGSQGPTASVSGWGGGNNRQSNGVSDMTANPNSENMVVDNEMGYAGLIGATGGADGKQNGGNNTYTQESSSHSIPPPRTGLLGGGEGNLNAPPNGWANSKGPGSSTSGWGTSVRSNTNSAVADMTGASGSGTSPTKPQGSWAQAAGKGLNPPLASCSSSNNVQNTATTVLEATSEAPQERSSTAKDRAEEQAKELRLKAAYSEGWGQNSVNQDIPWDVPSSPPPETSKETPPSAVWRAPVNNGTEIWENNLRMKKGTPAPVPTTTAPPWGHTPSSNIGGHWGDDDSSNNMWSGVPQNTNPNPATWSESNTSSSNSNMWGNPAPTEKHWSGNQSGASYEGSGGSDNGTSVWNAATNKGRGAGNWSPMATPKKDIPPSGWEPPSPTTNRRPPATNYDDGTAVWGNPQRQGKVSHWKDMPATKPIMNSSNNMVGPTGMPPANLGGMPLSGPGMIRFPTGPTNQKLDMPTDVWSTKKPPPPTRNSSWQDMPPHRDMNTWADESHSHNQMKNMGNSSNQPGMPYNAGWNDQVNNPLPYWGAKPKSNSNWADGQVDTSSWLGPAKQGGKPLSRDLIWASKQFRLLIEFGFKKEDAENVLRNNNMNFEDALNDLRGGIPLDNNMMDVDNYGGRKVRPATVNDDVSMPEHNIDSSFAPNNFHGPNNFQAMNFPGVQAFKQQVNKCAGPNTGNNANIINALGAQPSTIGSIGSLSPALVHKLLQQQQQQQPVQPFTPQNMPQNTFGNQSGRVGQNNFPSNAQLRHLVQQIQMAVQAGHLNPQILNQPLAPQTLQLLYQLLQQIKVLSQLQQQQVYQTQHLQKPIPGAPNNNSGLQLNVQLTQTKQRIVNFQNQIAAHQAVFLKTQMPPSQQSLNVPQAPTDIFKPNMEAMPALHSEFRDLSIKEPPPQNHQSRLNQWKLPSFEKDENQMCSATDLNPNVGAMSGSNGNSFGNDFSRAPGPLPNKPSSCTSSSMPNSGPNLHPLLGQENSAWSSLSRPHIDSGWPVPIATSSVANGNGSGNGNNTGSTIAPVMGSNQSTETKDSSAAPTTSGPSTSSASHLSYNLSDLVPEFEPGKPWKGSQMKNVEDDPHITPGSITRSPLSVNTIKETDIFWNSKTSPAISTSDTTGSLTSSTWTFNPTTAAGPNSSSGSKSANSKSNWGSISSSELSGSDMWGSLVSKSRGPPPGLSGQSWDRHNSSTFLILRNLTPQIDGSTLKTLCMQHGPLQLFHLSLNRGVALVRYSSREEASKAQHALNNCVLSNTTILVDIPSEGEIQQHIQVSSGQAAGSNGSWSASQQSSGSANFHGTGASYFGGSASGNGTNKDASGWNSNPPTSQLWSFSNSSLWGSSQPVNDHDPSTNPMNSYLPGDLLGSEPM